MVRSNLDMYAAIHPELISYYIAMLQYRFCDRNEVSAVTVACRLRDLKYAYLERRRDWALHELQLLTEDVREYALVAKGRSVVEEMLHFPPSNFVGPLIAQPAEPDPIRPGFRDSVIAIYYESRGMIPAGPQDDPALRRGRAEDATRQRFLLLSRRLERARKSIELFPSSLMDEYTSHWYIVDRTAVQDSIRFLSRYLTYRYTDDRPRSSGGISLGGLYLSSPMFSRHMELAPPVSYAIDARVRFERWMTAIGAAYAFTLRDALVPFHQLRFSASYAWSNAVSEQPADEFIANSAQPAAVFARMDVTIHALWNVQISATIPLWYPMDEVSLFGGGSFGLVQATYSVAYKYTYATIAPDSSKTFFSVSGESGTQRDREFTLEPLAGVEAHFGEPFAVVLSASLRRASFELVWYPW
jgi:hypothetical protein